MNGRKFLVLVSVAVGLSFSFNTYTAKEIKISSNNAAYSDVDVQKLAAIVVSMSVEEPISLSSGNGIVTVSGSSVTKYAFKVDNGGTLQIQGVSCK